MDAGATEITIMIVDGGRSSIRIIDNGCGMVPEDARLCIAPYATSKITQVEDLEYISSFGFRGEALASIAAISTMTLITKSAADALATQLVVHEGAIVHEQLISANTGTNIFIEDIFCSMPARKKFLKSRDTEWRAIYTLVQALALSHTACAFILMHEGQEVFSCKATQRIEDRVQHLFDSQWSQNGCTGTYDNEKYQVTVTGFCSNLQYHRYDRSYIFMFVNGRWVKNYKLSQAVIRGYKEILPPQRFPAAALFITCKTDEVDINIHPRKEEVMFMYPRVIEQAVESWISQSLEQQVKNTLRKPVSPEAFSYQAPFMQPRMSYYSDSGTVPAPTPFLTPSVTYQAPVTVQQRPFEEQPSYQYIGQLHSTYLLIEQPEGLIVIDQHAAHERILYEEFATKFTALETIELLFPPVITVTLEDHMLLREYQQVYAAHGIVLEEQMNQCWLLRSAPAILKNQVGEELIKNILTLIKEERHTDSTLLSKLMSEKIHAMMACKAAVKAGDTLSPVMAQQLIQKLLACPNSMSCPHGRPTLWRITLHEIEKIFKRVQ